MDILEFERKLMGSAEQAERDLIAKARMWRELRQPMTGTAKKLRLAEIDEREARFQLANAAIRWLWHWENSK